MTPRKVLGLCALAMALFIPIRSDTGRFVGPVRFVLHRVLNVHCDEARACTEEAAGVSGHHSPGGPRTLAGIIGCKVSRFLRAPGPSSRMTATLIMPPTVSIEAIVPGLLGCFAGGVVLAPPAPSSRIIERSTAPPAPPPRGV
jgi:hypothetical protein